MDHQRGPGPLLDLAVDFGAQLEIGRVDIGDDPRPDRAEGVVAFRAHPLTVLFLLVARRDVVGDRVAEDVLGCAGGRHVLARAADDRGQFAFEVHRMRVSRELDRGVGSDDRRVGLEEDDRVLEGAAAHLLDVGGVVLAHADDLAGQDRGEQPGVGERPLPPGEGGRTERMLGDLARDRLARLIGGAFDADEGDPVGAGDSAETHVFSLVPCRIARVRWPDSQHSLIF